MIRYFMVTNWKHICRELFITLHRWQSKLVLNPEKFQFTCRKVAFAGFHITEKIDPLPEF